MLTSSAPKGTEIRQHSDGLVDFVVRPTVEPAGYRIVRMDAISRPGRVSDAVLHHLRNDPLVVADMSFADPTVMYALGVRHSFGMPVIHVHTPSSVFPFDIEGLDAVVIDLADMTSVKQARRELGRRLEDRDGSQLDLSPVFATLRLDAMKEEVGAPGSDRLDEPFASRDMVNGLKAIEQRLAVLELLAEEARDTKPEVRSRRIFIVHGHDGELKHQLARVLTDLDFEVVILQEIADSGRTLLNKLHSELGQIGYVFVLLTADDFGGSKRAPEEVSDRARQNVIFEHGLLSGLLDSSRVCSIQRGDVELPSDLAGLVIKRIPEGAGIEAIQFDLVQELKRAGYDVDANQLMR